MRREHREQKGFVSEKAIRMRISRSSDLRAESQERFDSRNPVYAHSKVNDDKIGICREIDSSPLNSRGIGQNGGR